MDLFKIGSNIASMQALNSLYKLNSKLSVHQERLSTGKRVNSAQDDTAAFSVAKNVETTKQGHERALQNIKNAQSILNVIEAGQHKQLELLQEMKNKLSPLIPSTETFDVGTPGVSGLTNPDQNQSILDSISLLRQEIVDIANQMTFNGKSIASGSGATSTFRVGSGTASSDTFAVTSTVISSTSSISIASVSVGASMTDITTLQTLIDATLNRITNTGSAIERLKHKEDMIRSQIETNEAVRSNYEDADFAKEQMELMKVQILQQTATAALAQANSAPQSVLSLFR